MHCPVLALSRTTCFCVCLLALLSLPVPVLAEEPGHGEGRASDHILVKFKAGEIAHFVRKSDKTPLHTAIGRLNLPEGSELEESGFARWVRDKRKKEKGEAADPGVNFSRFMLLRLPPGLTPEECVERLKKHSLLEYAEVDPIGSGGATPTDPGYASMPLSSNQWHIGGEAAKDINALPAWDITQGTSSVIVAVLDTGVDTNILEFSGRTVPGYNFDTNKPPDYSSDDNGHGTAVASVLCASANNGTNGAGVDWNCRLMPVKVLNSANNGLYSWWANGINFAVSNGAKVINLSAGGANTNNTLLSAITNATAQGVIFVTITHNDSAGNLRYPGRYPQTIAVGATDRFGKRCGFSNYGPGIDLVAPGTNICTAGRNGAWQSWWGTSFSAPQVAGAAALLCSIRPDLTHEEARAALCGGAIDQGQLSADPNDTPGYDLYYGAGRLDVHKSLILVQTAIDSFVETNNANIALSWEAPSNAGNRKPFKVEFASAVTGAWSEATNVSYGASRAVWTDDGSETGTHPSNAPGRFYRVKVRGY